MEIKYIDSHAHLNEEIFDKDREKILKECEKKGIFVINCSGDYKGNRDSLNLLKYKNVKICLGIYPAETAEALDDEFFKEMNFIKENKEKIIGIGEVGLDFHWIKEKEKREKQIERFKEIIWLANKNNLPLNVHSRKAEEKTIDVLSKTANVPVVLHCFGGSIYQAKKAVGDNFYFSIPTTVIWSKQHQNLVKEIPIENLLTETDSPYLGPNRKRNDPRNIPKVVEKIAKIKEKNVKNIRKQILKNTKKVFNF